MDTDFCAWSLPLVFSICCCKIFLGGGLSQSFIVLLQQQQIFCILYEAYGSIIDILVFDAVAVIASYQIGYAAACVGLIHC